MTEKCFKIIFEGKVLQGRDLEEVKNELCRIFKWSRSRVDNLFSLAPITIAENIDYQTALKIYGPFKQAGVQCKIFRPEKGIGEPRKTTAPPASPRPTGPKQTPAGASPSHPSAPPSPPAGEDAPGPSTSSPQPSTPPHPSAGASPSQDSAPPRPQADTSTSRPSTSPKAPADASSFPASAPPKTPTGASSPQSSTPPHPSAGASPSPPSAPPSPRAGAAPPLMTCPKCGHKQKEGPECVRCGIIIARYIEFIKKKQKQEELQQKQETDEIKITEVTPRRAGPTPSSPSRPDTPPTPSGALSEETKETADDKVKGRKGPAETQPDIVGTSPPPGPPSALQAQKDKLFTYFSNLYQGSREEADDRGARRVIHLLFVLFTLLAIAIPMFAAKLGHRIPGIQIGALTFLVAAAILLPISRRIRRNTMQRIASYFKEKIALEQQQDISLFLAALILWAEQIPPDARGRDEIGAVCDEIALAHTPDQEEFTRYLNELSGVEKRSPDEPHAPGPMGPVGQTSGKGAQDPS